MQKVTKKLNIYIKAALLPNHIWYFIIPDYLPQHATSGRWYKKVP